MQQSYDTFYNIKSIHLTGKYYIMTINIYTYQNIPKIGKGKNERNGEIGN